MPLTQGFLTMLSRGLSALRRFVGWVYKPSSYKRHRYNLQFGNRGRLSELAEEEMIVRDNAVRHNESATTRRKVR